MFGDYSLGDLGAILAMQGFAGLILFSVYVLMALGLAIIFGQMGDIDKIAAASPGVEFKGAPEGYVRIHENHHLWSKTRVGKAKADGQYELIYETADLVEPDPFPKGYQ